jgi:cyclophilin family peptidyl-prolyl cis-trans isomerase
MTRFVGVAKGSRHKKPASTGGDRRTALAMFAVTGAHPELQEEATVGVGATAPIAPSARTQVRLVFSADGAVLGGPVAVQLFDDSAPESCHSFRARALSASGGHGALEGAAVCRVEEHVRVDVGGAASSGGGARTALEDEALRHDAPGLVSLLHSGQFTITLSACPALDGKQQVIGRVVSGHDTVELLGREPTDEGGRPKRKVFVCSATTDVGVDAKGSTALMMAAETKAQEAMRQATLKAERPAETRARLEREAAASRHEVAAAVNEALHNSKQRGSGAAVARPVRATMMDTLLASSGEDSDES